MKLTDESDFKKINGGKLVFKKNNNNNRIVKLNISDNIMKLTKNSEKSKG